MKMYALTTAGVDFGECIRVLHMQLCNMSDLGLNHIVLTNGYKILIKFKMASTKSGKCGLIRIKFFSQI